MAVLGRFQHITGQLYRDMDTGRFMPYSESAVLRQTARYYGYLGQGAGGNLVKAYDTMTELSGLSPARARALIADYQARYKTWLEEDREGDRPTLES